MPTWIERFAAVAREGAPAHVAEPACDRHRRLDVDDQQRLLEPGRPREHLAVVVQHDGVPVEDELVLAADRVDEGDEGDVVARPRGKHLLALTLLAEVERGGG